MNTHAENCLLLRAGVSWKLMRGGFAAKERFYWNIFRQTVARARLSPLRNPLKLKHHWQIHPPNDGDQEWRGGENEINKTGAYEKSFCVAFHSLYVSNFLRHVWLSPPLSWNSLPQNASFSLVRLIMSKQYFFHLLFRHLLDFLFIVARIISGIAKYKGKK